MNPPLTTDFSAALLRKDERLPVYFVVPYDRVAHWKLETTAIVEGTVNGRAFGRRSVKRMRPGPDSDWFVAFTAPICKAVGIDVGDDLTVVMRLAQTGLPEELETLLEADPSFRASRNALSEYARRTSAEHVRARKEASTRLRRAQAILNVGRQARAFFVEPTRLPAPSSF